MADPAVRSAAIAALPIRVDPALAEALVWRALSARREEDPAALARHVRRAEPLYAIDEAAERAAAFERLALDEFEELGLGDAIRAAIGERPAVAGRVRMVLLGEARGRQDEGVTWEPSGAHLGLRVDPPRFDRPDRLLSWARHLLGHAQDTLDPAFGFRPGWAESSLSRPAQQRLHDLWDVTLDARAEADGRAGAGVGRRDHRARLAAQLPGCPDAVVDALLDRLWHGPRPTHPELAAWASDRSALVAAVTRTAPGPGSSRAEGPDRCPLCRFPGGDIRVPESRTAAAVAREYPGWLPEHGLCGRCADRFRFLDRMGGHR